MKVKRILKWSVLGLLLVLFAWVQFAYWTSTNDCGRSIPAGAELMKAVRYCEYGAPDDVLKIERVEKPVPNDSQILVRVRAVSLRFYDGAMLGGSVPGRLLFGLRKPKNTCPASDFAGIVEAVGRNVSEFKPGDEVFGVRAGALSEYICVRQAGAIVSKPRNITFEEAATIPTALVSLQGLRDTARVKAGQKVLINGASGGVGTFAVQIAKSYGAEVTGVCSTRNVDLVRSIGADHVIDYTKEDFIQTERGYDVMLDLVGNRSLSDCRRALTPRGTYVLVGVSDLGRWFGLARQSKALLLAPFVRQRMRVFVVRHNREDLAVLKQLVEAGKVAPVIDRRYELSEVPEALRHQGQGHTQGKIVIAV